MLQRAVLVNRGGGFFSSGSFIGYICQRAAGLLSGRRLIRSLSASLIGRSVEDEPLFAAEPCCGLACAAINAGTAAKTRKVTAARMRRDFMRAPRPRPASVIAGQPGRQVGWHRARERPVLRSFLFPGLHALVAPAPRCVDAIQRERLHGPPPNAAAAPLAL